MINTEQKQSVNNLHDEIHQFLPDATSEQLQELVHQINKLQKVDQYFQAFPDDKTRFQDSWKRAIKALDYKKPYRISVIGTTGAGKSTLINAFWTVQSSL